MNNILGTLGLCRRAGKLVSGFDAVADEVKNPKSKVYGVILASDISEKTEKEVRFICGKFKVPVETVNATLDEIGGVMGKRTGVIAILDKGLFKSVTKHDNKLGDTE